MRKEITLLLAIASLLLLIQPTTAQTCLTSSEDYAVEIVLTDYSLFNLGNIAIKSQDRFVLPAEYDSRILAIIEETSFPQGLSIKLQLPTEIIEMKDPRIKLVSTSSTGQLREVDIASFQGWDVFCEEGSCEFSKNDRKLNVRTLGLVQEVTLEINEALEECTETCSGACFSTPTSSKCIDARTKNELDILLNFYNISNEFTDLLGSYRIVGSEEISLLDLVPKINPYINWQEAMRQELVFLTNQEILNLGRDEIESISALAQKGQAGQNYRIVFDFENQSWAYYDKTASPILTAQRDCNEYSQVKIEEPAESQIDTFYLVPAITVAAALAFILILVVVARVITSNPKNKPKEI